MEKLCFFIDTGAEFSIINEKLCNPRWMHDVNVTLRGKSKEFQVKTSCKFPIFGDFGCDDYLCEFLEYNFNKNFDGLIGSVIVMELDK